MPRTGVPCEIGDNLQSNQLERLGATDAVMAASTSERQSSNFGLLKKKYSLKPW